MKTPLPMQQLIDALSGEDLFHAACDSMAFWNAFQWEESPGWETWHTPAETIARDQGVCHDFAIGNYYTLIAHGIPESRLELIAVKLADGADHMICAASDTTGEYILDSLKQEAQLIDDCRDEYVPLYGISGSKMTVYDSEWGVLAMRPSSQSSQWVDLQARLAKE